MPKPAVQLQPNVIAFWKTAPMLRVLLPLLSGVAIADYAIPTIEILLPAAIVLLAILAFTYGISARYHWRWLWGLAFQIQFVVVGILVFNLHNEEKRNDFAGNFITGKEQYLVVTLNEPPVAKQKSLKANAHMALPDSQHNLMPVSGKVILYLQPSAILNNIGYGSQLLIKTKLQRIGNSKNPGAFDYAAWCARQGIYYQAYLREHEYLVLPGFEGNQFNRFIFNSRQAIHTRLQEIFHNNTLALGLSEALITGYRGDLDKEIVEQFANTGVVHVIAISGMHLALIFVLLQQLCKPLRLHISTRWLSFVIVLGGIWFFCLLTGASPSAVRAAIMLTVLVLGQLRQRKAPIINSLAVAATLQLIIDPYSLWDVGFQLSYAAVLSIAIFYKPLAARLWHQHIVLRWLGQMMAVTIAAQILTFPIAMYHFHQMPMMFLLANMIVVPITTAMLYALLLLIPSSYILPMAWLSETIAWLMQKMTDYVAWINALPGNKLSNISINIAELLMLFVAITFFARWLLQKRNDGLAWGLSAILLFTVSTTMRLQQQSRVQQLVMYQVPGMHALDIRLGRQAIFYGDSSLFQEGFLQRFHLLPARIVSQSFPTKQRAIGAHPFEMLTYSGQRFLFLNASPDYDGLTPLTADWLVPGSDLRTNPVNLLQKIKPAGILIDGALPEYRHARWVAAADSLHLRLHIIERDGPFVLHHR